MTRPSSSPDQKSDQGHSLGSEHLEAYSEYNKTLRAWFVAYGIGGPALFITNKEIAQLLAQNSNLKFVSALFLIGVGSQIIGAWINKTANWYVYSGENNHDTQTYPYKISEWLLKQFWIDLFLDMLTMGCFGYAAWIIFNVVK